MPIDPELLTRIATAAADYNRAVSALGFAQQMHERTRDELAVLLDGAGPLGAALRAEAGLAGPPAPRLVDEPQAPFQPAPPEAAAAPRGADERAPAVADPAPSVDAPPEPPDGVGRYVAADPAPVAPKLVEVAEPLSAEMIAQAAQIAADPNLAPIAEVMPKVDLDRPVAISDFAKMLGCLPQRVRDAIRIGAIAGSAMTRDGGVIPRRALKQWKPTEEYLQQAVRALLARDKKLEAAA